MSLGLLKKLEALAKKAGMGLVSRWMRSIVNHLYWSATTSAGDGQLALAKWSTLPRHITNVHDGHGDLFPSCSHDAINPRRVNKPWFKPGSFILNVTASIQLLIVHCMT